MTNVKWLEAITVLEEPFQGYQNAVAYRLYAEDGTRESRSPECCLAH